MVVPSAFCQDCSQHTIAPLAKKQRTGTPLTLAQRPPEAHNCGHPANLRGPPRSWGYDRLERAAVRPTRTIYTPHPRLCKLSNTTNSIKIWQLKHGYGRVA